MTSLRLALAQTNPVVGDIRGNLSACFEACEEAYAAGARVILFGEMVATGYPIEDLATRESFVRDAEKQVANFAERLATAGMGDLAVAIGHPSLANPLNRNGWAIAHNSASVLINGKVAYRYDKHHLPNYSVFDEYRNFVPGNDLVTFEHLGHRFALAICEDIWQTGGPVAEIKTSGAAVTLVLNGSPFELDKDETRLNLVRGLAKRTNTAVAYVNLVGGQDDLVFDGASLFVSPSGELVHQLEQFETQIGYVDLTESHLSPTRQPATTLSDEEQIWNALVLGLRDYVGKNGFKSVVLGLSGGIDSAVCAAIAADAIGASNVFGVSMPSKYSSEHSKDDASELADNIGLNYQTVAIEPMVQAFESNLELGGLASENLQARVRGVILMGLSNASGHLTLTTGNKTELAVGYSTIYGDSVGGYAPIKDIEKTMVWKLARYRNALAVERGETTPIPVSSIEKPPSAELRPDQLDQDSLPDYEVLDSLLEAYIEQRKSAAELVAMGFESDMVHRIISLVDRAEWKRRQGAIGPKVTGMAFGRDRRLPITNKNREF
jgi:NAD+ synthase (glutamine-hydrolysing)